MMPPFRTVSGGRAGPKALGILVPPGQRTLIVLRPRALPIDLVVSGRRVEGGWDEGFLEADRQQAGLQAQKLGNALVHAAETGTGRVEVAPRHAGQGYWLQVEVDEFLLIACAREPGQPYRPRVFATLAEGRQLADALRPIVCPTPDANQELYTNFSQFERSSPVRS